MNRGTSLNMLAPLLNLFGWIFVGLALVGVVMPLVPATPFVLLAAACFSRSSPQAYRRLIRSRVLGPILIDWHKQRAIRLSVKLTILAIVAVAVALTFIGGSGLGLRQTLALIGLGITTIALTIVPTLRPERRAEQAA